MFARPITNKKEKKKVQSKNSVGQPVQQIKKLSSHHRSRQPVMNKMASIRTLPPLAYINSESGGNSQQYSDNNSEIWKQED